MERETHRRANSSPCVKGTHAHMSVSESAVLPEALQAGWLGGRTPGGRETLLLTIVCLVNLEPCQSMTGSGESQAVIYKQ